MSMSRQPRTILALLGILGIILAAACSPTGPQGALPTLAATAFLATREAPTATPSLTPPPTETPIPTATATVTPPPTATAVSYHLPPADSTPQPYLSQFRLLAYYGSPVGPGLGLLGEMPRADVLSALRETAAAYAPYSPERLILPTYHMVVTVANPYPPLYRHMVDEAIIGEWIEAAKAAEAAVILDIQPGREGVMQAFARLRPFLYEPHVHLAVDPEFVMNQQQIPGQVIGQLFAADINALQAELNAIAIEIGVNRVLILHQFANKMLPDKENIVDFPFVELVIDGDGFGSDMAKVRNYTQYAAEAGFEYGGFKLFPTDGDWPLMSPEDVMTRLSPAPVLIIYQ